MRANRVPFSFERLDPPASLRFVVKLQMHNPSVIKDEDLTIMVEEYLAAEPLERGTLGRIIAEYDKELYSHFHKLEARGPESYTERLCLQDLLLVAAVGPYEDPRDLSYMLDVVVRAALLMERDVVQRCYDEAAAVAQKSGFGWVADQIRKYPAIFWTFQDRPGKEYWL